LQAADLVTAIKKEYLPNISNKQMYADLYGVFCEVHDLMQKPFEALAKANNG
jgi:hypothetical protein